MLSSDPNINHYSEDTFLHLTEEAQKHILLDAFLSNDVQTFLKACAYFQKLSETSQISIRQILDVQKIGEIYNSDLLYDKNVRLSFLKILKFRF